MGFFDRIRSLFGRSRDVDFGDDRLNEVWHSVTDEMSSRQAAQFADEAKEVFETAYVDEDADHEERIAAREEFESLLSDYSVDIADFDWDAWRDWYESQG